MKRDKKRDKTQFEKDISFSNSFSELMLSMETKGVFVGEKFVSERILETISDRRIYRYWSYDLDGYEDWELMIKATWLLGDLLSEGKHLWLAGKMVDAVFSLVSYIDPSRCLQNRRISDFATVLMDSLEKTFPGILRSSRDKIGRNLVETLFSSLSIGQKISAANSIGLDSTEEIAEIGKFAVQNTGVFDILCFLVQKAGFDPDKKYSQGVSISLLIGSDFLIELFERKIPIWSTN